jgi:hypothetical protein
MAWTRRRWLSFGLIAAAAAGAGAWLQSPRLLRRIRIRLKPLGALEREMLARVVDLLVPADDEAPGATELGVAEIILAKAAHNRELAEVIASGCLLLDTDARRLSGRTWLDLATDGQQSSLQQLADSTTAEFPNIFFRRLRQATLDAYYSNPASWPQLSFRGPPQPAGYGDYTEPPARRAG